MGDVVSCHETGQQVGDSSCLSTMWPEQECVHSSLPEKITNTYITELYNLELSPSYQSSSINSSGPLLV